jgi:iron complex transport system permease protein
VFGLAHGTGSWTPSRLLLTGVVVAAGWGAVITLMLAISPAERLPGMLYWLMGDLSYSRSPWPPLALLLLMCLLLLPLGRSLNVWPEARCRRRPWASTCAHWSGRFISSPACSPPPR